MAKSLILLGTNLGNKTENLSGAIREISSACGKILAVSSVYETEPWGGLSDNFYLNQAVITDTIHHPFSLLDALQNIELKMGRIREKKWEDRIIDLDIIFYENFVVDSHILTIPHKELPNRKFSLIPSCEIAENWEHPLLHVTLKKMLDLCTDAGEVKKRAV